VIDHSFLRFALVGLANTAVGYGVILLLHYGLGAPPRTANAGGYVIGALLSYALNRVFTFGSQRPHGQAMPRFVAAIAACFVLNLLVLEAGLRVLALPVALAQALAMASYTLAFYLVSRYIVFRT
jgi:putative flippase GtrA